jgi:hypothetical protein
MDAGKHWRRIPVRMVDQKVLGRTIRAYRHRTGALLLHNKLTSRNASYYRKVGVWTLRVSQDVVATKPYYERPINVPPMRWANSELRRRRAWQV